MTRADYENLKALVASPTCPTTLNMSKEDVQALVNKIERQQTLIERRDNEISEMGWRINPDRMGS